MRARFYNPRIGRFLQEDIYRGDGLNLYAYCQNNPVMYYDPSGYVRLCPAGKTTPEDEHKKALPEKVINDLSDYSTKQWNIDGNEIILDKKVMKHVLERHHPNYWNGTTKAQQSFLDGNMSIVDIQNVAGQVITQNRSLIISKGTTGMYQVEGVVDGITYILGFKNGRIGQLYPK